MAKQLDGLDRCLLLEGDEQARRGRLNTLSVDQDYHGASLLEQTPLDASAQALLRRLSLDACFAPEDR